MNDFQIYLFLYINYVDISPRAQACTGIAEAKEGGSFRVGAVSGSSRRPCLSAWGIACDSMRDGFIFMREDL